MASEQLNLAVTGAPLPPNFIGTPQELFEAMLTRMRVVFPTGQTSFVISDTEPSTNLGPWLKNGTQWYVWDETTKRYIPLDIDPSMKLVVISDTAPANGDKPLWLQFKGTRVIRWNAWLGGAWKPLTNRGTTADRPTDPLDYERFEDTTIQAEIVYYDGGWHTVSGVPGDVKHVAWPTLAQALQYNPGWQEVGQFFSNTAVRGRALVAAHKDSGLTPVATFAPEANITARGALDKYGEETHTLTERESEAAPHQHMAALRTDPGSNDMYMQIADPRNFSSAIAGLGTFRSLGDGSGPGFISSDNMSSGDLVTSNPIHAGSSITGITRTGTTAAVTCDVAHGLTTGTTVLIDGADQLDYNGTFVVTVISPTVYTITVANSPVSPATGSITWRSNTTANAPHNNIQPTMALWCLVKL